MHTVGATLLLTTNLLMLLVLFDQSSNLHVNLVVKKIPKPINLKYNLHYEKNKHFKFLPLKLNKHYPDNTIQWLDDHVHRNLLTALTTGHGTYNT